MDIGSFWETGSFGRVLITLFILLQYVGMILVYDISCNTWMC